MNVGELFVSLGVKGADKSVGAISSVTKGLGDTKDMALEAKAGILAALYAFEQLVSSSNQTGTSLVNMNAELGVGTKTFQEFAYAASRASISSETVASSMKTLQSSMTKLLAEGSTNKWLGEFMRITGTLGSEWTNLQKHPEQMILKLQDFYNKASSMGRDKGWINMVMESFGQGAMIPAYARNEFRPEVMKQAQPFLLGDNEVKKLDEMNVRWHDLYKTLETDIAHLNVAFGPTFLSGIEDIEKKLLRLGKSFAEIVIKGHALEAIGLAFKGWGEIFDGIGVVLDKLTEFMSKYGPEATEKKGATNIVTAQENATTTKGAGFGQRIMDSVAGGGYGESLTGILADMIKGAVAPSVPGEKSASATNVNVNNNITYQHDGKDASKIERDHQNAAQKAYTHVQNTIPRNGGT